MEKWWSSWDFKCFISQTYPSWHYSDRITAIIMVTTIITKYYYRCSFSYHHDHHHYYYYYCYYYSTANYSFLNHDKVHSLFRKYGLPFVIYHVSKLFRIETTSKTRNHFEILKDWSSSEAGPYRKWLIYPFTPKLKTHILPSPFKRNVLVRKRELVV